MPADGRSRARGLVDRGHTGTRRGVAIRDEDQLRKDEEKLDDTMDANVDSLVLEEERGSGSGSEEELIISGLGKSDANVDGGESPPPHLHPKRYKSIVKPTSKSSWQSSSSVAKIFTSGSRSPKVILKDWSKAIQNDTIPDVTLKNVKVLGTYNWLRDQVRLDSEPNTSGVSKNGKYGWAFATPGKLLEADCVIETTNMYGDF